MAALTCVPAVTVAATPATAAVDNGAEVAPGAPMRMQIEGMERPENMPPEVFTAMSCSQGVPGTVTLPDGSKRNVMVSAAHCVKGTDDDDVQPDVYVYAPLEEGNELIAMAAHGEKMRMEPGEHWIETQLGIPNMPDWATADLGPDVEMSRVADSVDQYGRRHGEPVELTGVRDYRDLQDWEISFDNFGQPICKDGQTSGRTCGIQFMRTRNGLWYLGTGIPGDSGGVNFDPNNGEALGVSSLASWGLVVRAQPVDIALEEAYDIPDGQVNEYFALPDSTAPHAPMRTFEEDQQATRQWMEENSPEALDEPVTFESAKKKADQNIAESVAEAHVQARDSVNLLSEDPTQVGQVAENAVNTALYVGERLEGTARAYAEAFQTSLEEE
ncbi:hypothetical protein [Corynebacterium lowii]|uniref:Trypsin n=1 Tax=Corynebacterium lowii TaxID=1544413 RepID=A0A0Q0UK16_9CORY|nr:hypothetical protein [Corynebacterium lowii]KQB86605.1 hypothetical protein Clow_00813 [Corynebacterium lowii]MDP9851289.1 hypothetical protein [Corynebacterium lowii]